MLCGDEAQDNGDAKYMELRCNCQYRPIGIRRYIFNLGVVAGQVDIRGSPNTMHTTITEFSLLKLIVFT